MKRFRFRIDVEEILTVDEIWPDGDAPENPTAADVRKRFAAEGRNAIHAAEAWGLLDNYSVEIDEL